MMSFATGMLSQADGALAGASDSLQTARELMISAGNGSLQPEDRKSIALQLRNVRNELLAIANQRDGAGGYIFGGQGSATAPFTSTGTPPATVVFEPTGGTQQTGLDMTFDTTVDGGKVFLGGPGGGGSIFEALDTLVLHLEDDAIDGAALRAGLDAALGPPMPASTGCSRRAPPSASSCGSWSRAAGCSSPANCRQPADLPTSVSTDYAKVVSEMQTNQLAVDAAMRTYAQISRMSLFDYL